MNKDYDEQEDGVRFYHKDKVPPFPPEGFKRHKLHKHVFEPILQPCKHREEKTEYVERCGCRAARRYCHLFEKYVTLMECIKCEKSESA